NRGRYDARENIFRADTLPSIPAVFTQKIATLTSSTNGIVEYRSQTFNNAMRGELIAQKHGGATYRLKLSANGGSATVSNLSVSLNSLDVTLAPGGVLFGTNYHANSVMIAKPNDATASTVFDIFPWRAPKSGGASFTIAGAGFGTSANTTVSIGGVQAVLTSVTPNRIRGLIPANSGAPDHLVDVIVTVSGQQLPLPAAFLYLDPADPNPVKGVWESGNVMPAPLGEVAAGIVAGKLYIVGEGDANTYAYDLAYGTWTAAGALAPRAFPGHHHAAEVVNGKLYLIGGLGGAAGKVQIYDPGTNTWTLGADMPFAAGSSSTSVINGQIYVAGGIVSGVTVTTAAKYNPVTNTWTSIAPMPLGRNHTAAATDGSKMYIFGGRGGGNTVANGFADVQVYNPANNTWASSHITGSGLAPLPQARGGMGKAVYYAGEFYIFGGETSTGAGATSNRVYDRVDIYNPVANTWRLGAPIPTARHGIFPLLHGWRIHVVGGGIVAGHSDSNVNEVYVPKY
ncbi:MAG TPA: kelch repeat-containing protein, partial [Bryobacteraceae bacterium]|nr:kelch repeat-containing protein [Bryobacteraceae bacterium]